MQGSRHFILHDLLYILAPFLHNILKTHFQSIIPVQINDLFPLVDWVNDHQKCKFMSIRVLLFSPITLSRLLLCFGVSSFFPNLLMLLKRFECLPVYISILKHLMYYFHCNPKEETTQKSKSKSSLFRQGGPFSTRLVSIGALRN